MDLTLLLGDAINAGSLPDADLLALVLLLSNTALGLDIDQSTIGMFESTVANSTAATALIKGAFNVSVDSFFNLFNFSTGELVFDADDDALIDQLNRYELLAGVH